MASKQRRQWVMLETSRGNIVVTEMQSNGFGKWEVNPVDLGERLERSRKLLSAECRERSLTVAAVMRSQPAVDDAPRPRLERYARDLYSFASAEAWAEPPDAVGEVPTLASHECGLPIKFSLDCFRHFDLATIRVDPVEPLDSQFGKYGGRCLLLHNVLTKEECEYLIQQMSVDMEGVRYRHDYRRNDRCIFESPELASLLWNRVKHVDVVRDLSIWVDADAAKQHAGLEPEAEGAGHCPEELRVGYGSEGAWHPVGLNECLRFCRYSSGGFFRAHCDQIFRRSKDEKSLFTCMFYLNGDLDGGATRFLRVDSQLTPDNQYNAAQDDQVLASIPPEAGLCILFFQPGLLHEGQDLHSGEKFILRSDVMFRRDPGSAPQLTPQQRDALQALEEAQLAESRRDFVRSTGLYKRAFRLDPRLERLV